MDVEDHNACVVSCDGFRVRYKNLEIYGACQHKTTFRRFFLSTDDRNDASLWMWRIIKLVWYLVMASECVYA